MPTSQEINIYAAEKVHNDLLKKHLLGLTSHLNISLPKRGGILRRYEERKRVKTVPIPLQLLLNFLAVSGYFCPLVFHTTHKLSLKYLVHPLNQNLGDKFGVFC